MTSGKVGQLVVSLRHDNTWNTQSRLQYNQPPLSSRTVLPAKHHLTATLSKVRKPLKLFTTSSS